ncbi:hypothetical protein BJ508DRAFT_64617 [Ascobolus immersus RN42]|uniref:Uncharacterized protein n=1 Tax=Ascobolus immersus RN42 TaxID=1160509 RepID=A0A3N4IU75_ASCIM|nr:hypothetical protein BJ508DRAFT_64617 [Ascobolus immersus RN42]
MAEVIKYVYRRLVLILSPAKTMGTKGDADKAKESARRELEEARKFERAKEDAQKAKELLREARKRDAQSHKTREGAEAALD